MKIGPPRLHFPEGQIRIVLATGRFKASVRPLLEKGEIQGNGIESGAALLALSFDDEGALEPSGCGGKGHEGGPVDDGIFVGGVVIEMQQGDLLRFCAGAFQDGEDDKTGVVAAKRGVIAQTVRGRGGVDGANDGDEVGLGGEFIQGRQGDGDGVRGAGAEERQAEQQAGECDSERTGKRGGHGAGGALGTGCWRGRDWRGDGRWLGCREGRR